MVRFHVYAYVYIFDLSILLSFAYALFGVFFGREDFFDCNGKYTEAGAVWNDDGY